MIVAEILVPSIADQRKMYRRVFRPWYMMVLDDGILSEDAIL